MFSKTILKLFKLHWTERIKYKIFVDNFFFNKKFLHILIVTVKINFLYIIKLEKLFFSLKKIIKYATNIPIFKVNFVKNKTLHKKILFWFLTVFFMYYYYFPLWLYH